MSNPVGLLRHPALALAVGMGATATDGVSSAYRAVTRVPVLGPRLDRAVAAMTRRGDDVLTHSVEPIRALVTAVAPAIVEQVLAELDLTAVVRDQVDVDAIVADVDIDRIIARIDLVGLAETIIDGVDLPRIIRESTTSVTAEVMTDVRTQGERADDLVSGIVDRVLGRGRTEP